MWKFFTFWNHQKVVEMTSHSIRQRIFYFFKVDAWTKITVNYWSWLHCVIYRQGCGDFTLRRFNRVSMMTRINVMIMSFNVVASVSPFQGGSKHWTRSYYPFILVITLIGRFCKWLQKGSNKKLNKSLRTPLILLNSLRAITLSLILRMCIHES